MDDANIVNTLSLQSALHEESLAKKRRIDSATQSRNDDSGDTTTITL